MRMQSTLSCEETSFNGPLVALLFDTKSLSSFSTRLFAKFDMSVSVLQLCYAFLCSSPVLSPTCQSLVKRRQTTAQKNGPIGPKKRADRPNTLFSPLSPPLVLFIKTPIWTAGGKAEFRVAALFTCLPGQFVRLLHLVTLFVGVLFSGLLSSSLLLRFLSSSSHILFHRLHQTHHHG